MWDKDPSSAVPPSSPKPSSWQEAFPEGGKGHCPAAVPGGAARLAARCLCIAAQFDLHSPDPAVPGCSGLAVNHSLQIRATFGRREAEPSRAVLWGRGTAAPRARRLRGERRHRASAGGRCASGASCAAPPAHPSPARRLQLIAALHDPDAQVPPVPLLSSCLLFSFRLLLLETEHLMEKTCSAASFRPYPGPVSAPRWWHWGGMEGTDPGPSEPLWEQ